MAADSCASSGDISSILAKLVEMLQHGPIGLALALIVVLFGSLAYLYWRASSAGAGGTAFDSVAQLMRYGMALIALLFVGAIIGPAIADRVRPPIVEPIQSKYKVSFSVNPSGILADQLEPRLLVLGTADPIVLKEGTGQDTISGERSYMIKVGGLVGEIERLHKLVGHQGGGEQ